MIDISNISYSVNNKMLLQNVSINLASGQLLTILGPNGAGKSTLLKSISGDITPASGGILVNDKNLSEYSVEEIALTRAVVEQSTNVLFPFTVYDVVSFGRYPFNKGHSSHEDETIIHDVMQQLDILSMSSQIYSTLSGGEKQRVQMARAIVQIYDAKDLHGKLLLLDEPFSNMDLCHQHHCLKLLSDLCNKGCTVMTVLHDLNLATAYSTHIALLAEGKLVSMGTSENFNDVEMITSVFGIRMELIQHPQKNYQFINPVI